MTSMDTRAERLMFKRTARRLGLARKANRVLRRQLYEAQRELAQAQRDHQDLITRVGGTGAGTTASTARRNGRGV